MHRTQPEREMYQMLHQPGLHDSEGRSDPEAFERIRLLARGRSGLRKTLLAVDALAMTDSAGGANSAWEPGAIHDSSAVFHSEEDAGIIPGKIQVDLHNSGVASRNSQCLYLIFSR